MLSFVTLFYTKFTMNICQSRLNLTCPNHYDYDQSFWQLLLLCLPVYCVATAPPPVRYSLALLARYLSSVP